MAESIVNPFPREQEKTCIAKYFLIFAPCHDRRSYAADITHFSKISSAASNASFQNKKSDKRKVLDYKIDDFIVFLTLKIIKRTTVFVIHTRFLNISHDIIAAVEYRTIDIVVRLFFFPVLYFLNKEIPSSLMVIMAAEK